MWGDMFAAVSGAVLLRIGCSEGINITLNKH